jgi:hypothetical protein
VIIQGPLPGPRCLEAPQVRTRAELAQKGRQSQNGRSAELCRNQLYPDKDVQPPCVGATDPIPITKYIALTLHTPSTQVMDLARSTYSLVNVIVGARWLPCAQPCLSLSSRGRLCASRSHETWATTNGETGMCSHCTSRVDQFHADLQNMNVLNKGYV